MKDQIDVFISYNMETGYNDACEIVDRLESGGIKCWFAPRNCKEFYSESITVAIRECKIFILLLNERSNISNHVKRELDLAVNLNKKIIPFRLDDCILSDSASYYLAGVHIINGTVPPHELRVAELIDRVTSLLEMQPAMTKTAPSDIVKESGPDFVKDVNDKYSIVGNIVYPDNKFVGREKELEKLNDYLLNGEKVVFLVGMGGIGKSEIVKMYIKKYSKAKYDLVIWVDFNTSLEKTFSSDNLFLIRGIERESYPQDDERAYFQRKLRLLKEIANDKVLIVIDNFDVRDDPDLDLICSGEYSVVFTSRFHQAVEKFASIDISFISDPEISKRIFRSEYTRNVEYNEEKNLEKLIYHLTGHPLTLRLFASTMMSKRIRPGEMLRLIGTDDKKTSDNNAKVLDSVLNNLKSILMLSSLSENELYIMINLSVLPNSGIDTELFYSWCELDDYEDIDGLIQKSYIMHDPSTDKIWLQNLISHIFFDELKSDPQICRKLIMNIYKEDAFICKHNSQFRSMLFDYAEEVYKKLSCFDFLHDYLLCIKADAYKNLSQYENAIPLYKELWQNGSDDELRFKCCSKMAQFLYLNGQYEQAYSYASDAWDKLSEMPDEYLSDGMLSAKGMILKRMAESSRALGQYEEALKYINIAIEKGNVYFKSDISETGWNRWHLGRILYDLNRLDESEAEFNNAYKLFKELNDEWAASYSLDMLGQIYMRRGQFDKAIEASVSAYDTLVFFIGTEHQDVAVSLKMRGNIYLAQNDREKAKECYLRSIEIFKKTGGTINAEEVGTLLEKCL